MLCSQPCSLLLVLMVIVQYPMHTSLIDNTVIECANMTVIDVCSGDVVLAGAQVRAAS